MKCFECELDFKICAQCGVDPTTCTIFKRKQMDKIEIDVRVNGKAAKLSDISDETLANIKKSEFKPIGHGDYGLLSFSNPVPRFFFEIDGKIAAYDESGTLQANDANEVDKRTHSNNHYIIQGNIFKDLQNE